MAHRIFIILPSSTLSEREVMLSVIKNELIHRVKNAPSSFSGGVDDFKLKKFIVGDFKDRNMFVFSDDGSGIILNDIELELDKNGLYRLAV